MSLSLVWGTALVAGAVIVVTMGLLVWLLLSSWRDAEAQKGSGEESMRDVLDPGFYVSPLLMQIMECSDAARSASRAARRRAASAEADAGTDAGVDLTVVIPAFNERERLPLMLAEMLEHLHGRGGMYEVLIVDDCSEDETGQMVLDRYTQYIDPTTHFKTSRAGEARTTNHMPGPQQHIAMRVVRLRKNQGKGFAVKIGMLSARGRLRLMVDADGATKFADLDKLEAGLSAADVEIAFGSRHHLVEGATARRAWYRNIFTWGLHFLVKVLITGFDDRHQVIHDTQCGFKLFTCAATLRIFPSLHVRRWAFDLEVVVLARMQSLRIAEVSVRWEEIPGSKLGLLSATASMLRDMLRIRLSYMLGLWRIREVGPGFGIEGEEPETILGMPPSRAAGEETRRLDAEQSSKDRLIAEVESGGGVGKKNT